MFAPRTTARTRSGALAFPFLAVLGIALATAGQQAAPTAQPPTPTPAGTPLFIDDAHDPAFTLAWTRRDGTRVELAHTMPWGTANDREDLGHNILAFVAVGGTRIDLQQGHPLGSVVRVGFYRKDITKPFFADIKPGSTIELRFTGIRFLEPARPTTATTLQHLQYHLQDVLDCGLDASAIDQYNTASPTETLGGNLTARNGRPGVLRVRTGEPPADEPRYFRQPPDPTDDAATQPAERFASVRFHTDATTSDIELWAEFPYEIFRHVRDPWQRTEPGTFFEPTHFHVEFECLPVRAAEPAAEGAPRP